MGFVRKLTGSSAASAAKKAANIQSAATDRAADVTKEIYEQNRSDLAPQRAVGNNALYSLSSALGVQPSESQLQALGLSSDEIAGFGQGGGAASLTDMLQSDPGYQFRLDQGNRAVERSAAARGGLFSGKTGKSLQDYSQGLASQETSNAFNRLASLAGIGQQATAQGVQLGAQFGQQQSSLITGGANARASGYVGAANAKAQGLQGLLGMGTTLGAAYLMK